MPKLAFGGTLEALILTAVRVIASLSIREFRSTALMLASRNGGAMNEGDRFASDGNILCFADQLRWETNAVRRDRLRRLLIEEENRFGAIESRLATVERNLRDGAEILVRQKRLIAEVRGKGGDTGNLESTLRTMEMIQDLFERFGARLAARERGRT